MKIRKHDICEVQDDQSEKVFYDNPDYPSFLRTSYIPEGFNLRAVSHWHDEVEFIYVIQGNVKYNVNNVIIDIKVDEGIFVNSRQMHYILSGDKSETILFCALLHPMLLCASKYIEMNFVTPLITNVSIPYVKLESKIEWQNTILQSVKIMCECVNDDMAELMIQHQFFKLWESLYRHVDVNQTVSKTTSSKLRCLNQMVSYIDEHYKENITLEDLCVVGTVSKTTCCSLFKNYTNSTPVKFLQDYRLQKGAELLTNTELSITEICYETGFSGASYFTEYFKKRYEMTPSEYRKRG